MIRKTELMNKAIALRKKGVTYSGILDKIPVAKSTLALWFKDVKLSRPQVHRITRARIEAAQRGADKKKNDRILRMGKIIEEAEREVGKITAREAWLVGTTMYWAEGSKEKEWLPGSSVQFINMDPFMIQAFLKWLRICKVSTYQIYFEIYVHESSKARTEEIRQYWSKVTHLPLVKFEKVYFKKDRRGTRRRRVGEDYFGILKVRVRQSSTLVRKIAGWTRGIYKGINSMSK